MVKSNDVTTFSKAFELLSDGLTTHTTTRIGSFWEFLGASRSIWKSVVASGSFRELLELLGVSGGFWGHLGTSGVFW